MRKRIQKSLILVLMIVMTANMTIGVGYAAETAKPPEVDTEAPQVIATKTLSASQCKQMYQAMGDYSSWTAGLASTFVRIIGGSLGGAAGLMTDLGSLIQCMNFYQAKAELKAGWKSGKGCKMIIYDNAAPCILAL